LLKTTDSLKKIERQAYRTKFSDGIYDMFFGLAFMIVAWIPVLESIGVPRTYGYSFGLIPLLIAWLAKRYLTIPRLGAVEFGPKRRAKKWLLIVICAAIVFLVMPLLMMMAAEGSSAKFMWIAIAPLAALFMALAAYFMDYPRLYIYAIVLVYGIVQSEFLYQFVGRPLNSLISFGIPGLAILVFGLTLLVGFLKKYPRPTAEASHVG